jgi:hypothetical protein
MPDENKVLFSWRSLAAAVALTAAFAGLLALEDRPGWCKYGFTFWTPAWTHCTSQNLLDPYSLSHVLHGVIFFWMLCLVFPKLPLRWQLVIAMLMEVLWELLENSPWVIERYRQQTASLDYAGDSVVNSVSDLAMTVIGFCLASRISWKAAVVVFIVFELVALWMARDNLTTNVLMLFLPLESLKEWQMQGM